MPSYMLHETHTSITIHAADCPRAMDGVLVPERVHEQAREVLRGPSAGIVQAASSHKRLRLCMACLPPEVIPTWPVKAPGKGKKR